MDLLLTDSMGWTPIMIKTIINEALIQAYQDGRDFLTYKDWLDAADEREMGLKQPIRSWNLTDRLETAYHEAGHAVAAHYLMPEHRISKATIIRRGHALGYVQHSDREERTSLYARSIESGIMVSLAGHAVEDRFLDKLTTGPSSDLQSATIRAERYVGQLAMGPTKLVLPLQPGQPPPGPVLVAAHELLDQLYEETVRLLREKEPALHHLAKALIERDEIIGTDLEDVFADIEERRPELMRPFERRIVQFREFAPAPQQRLNEWTPATATGQEQVPAARDGWTPAGDTVGVPVAAGPSRRGMDPGATPPWANRT